VEAESLELKPGLLRACGAALKTCAQCGDDGWATGDAAACALKCLHALASPADTEAPEMNPRCRSQLAK
jgi:hypothetical protein